jgi:hypothetical protein
MSNLISLTILYEKLKPYPTTEVKSFFATLMVLPHPYYKKWIPLIQHKYYH